MKIIGIDIGTNCGWAVLDGFGNRIASGVWDFKPRRHEGGGMRYIRARQFLLELLQTLDRSEVIVAYEEVRNHLGVDASHIYGGILAQISSVCEEMNVPYEGVPVGTIKKTATGYGIAKKKEMIAAADDRWRPHKVEDDNEADAMWTAMAFIEQHPNIAREKEDPFPLEDPFPPA